MTIHEKFAKYRNYYICQERIMKEGRGGGKEREVPTHLIEISALTHAACVTKNSQTARYVAKKSKSVAVFVIQNLPLGRGKG